MEPEDHLQIFSEMVAAYCSRQNVTVPEDFLEAAAKALTQLQIAGRSNFLCALAKGLGTQHSDGSDSLFPCKQVVAGLLEHCANFFVVSYGDQVIGKNIQSCMISYMHVALKLACNTTGMQYTSV